MNDNPYQAPKAASTTTGKAGLPAYQDPLAGYLVLNKNFTPPNRCLFTGEPSLADVTPNKVTLVYFPRILQIIFIALIAISSSLEAQLDTLFPTRYLPIIVPLLLLLQTPFRKSIKINVHYGESVQATKTKRRKWGIPLLAISPVAVFGIFQVGLSSLYVLIPFGVLITSLVLGLALTFSLPRALKVKKYKDGYFFVKGVHPSVLERYPPLPEGLR